MNDTEKELEELLLIRDSKFKTFLAECIKVGIVIGIHRGHIPPEEEKSDECVG